MKLIKESGKILEGATMVISRGSSISSDSIEITITDGDKKVFSKKYSYGYDASHGKSFATKDKPFIEDIIQGLKTQYNVTHVEEVKGRNVFKEGAPVLKEQTSLKPGTDVVWYDAGVGKDWGRVVSINSDGTVKVKWDDGKVSDCERSNLRTEDDLDEEEIY